MFNEIITTQIALEFITRQDDKTLNYTKLLKLLYFVDRELLQKCGYRATYDSYTNMRNGVVLSHTYNLIKGEYLDSLIWENCIGTEGNDVFLISKPTFPIDLDFNILEIIDKLEEQYHDKRYGILIEAHHKLPEWHNTQHSDTDFNEIIQSLEIMEEEKKTINTFERLNGSHYYVV